MSQLDVTKGSDGAQIKNHESIQTTELATSPETLNQQSSE